MSKKIIGIVAIVVLALLVLAGCGSKTEKTILGDWEYEGGGFIYHFNEDGTGTYLDTMNFTYTEENGNVKIKYDGADNTLEGTWEEDTLNMIDSFGNDTIYKRK